MPSNVICSRLLHRPTHASTRVPPQNLHTPSASTRLSLSRAAGPARSALAGAAALAFSPCPAVLDNVNIASHPSLTPSHSSYYAPNRVTGTEMHVSDRPLASCDLCAYMVCSKVWHNDNRSGVQETTKMLPAFQIRTADPESALSEN